MIDVVIEHLARSEGEWHAWMDLVHCEIFLEVPQ